MLGAVSLPAVAAAEPAASPAHAVWLAIPSIDGAAGLEVGGELGLAPRRAVALSLSARRTAASDYRALRLGVAGEYRWYWRRTSRWSSYDRTGFFLSGRLDVATSHLTMDERAVGTLVSVGLRGGAGYRLVPWRRLALTAIADLGANTERDAGGRLPAETHRTLGFGLDVGWMF